MHDSRARRGLFYAVVAGSLALLVTKTHALFLPAGLASQIGHNSEALLFALLVAAQIQYVRPRLLASSRKWLVATTISLAHFLIAYALLQTGWTSSVVTLNEPIVAAGLMMPYLLIPRPFRQAPAVTLAVLTFVVVFFDTTFVLDQAESLVPFMLAPLALDVFDRTILEPDQQDRPLRRGIWMVALVAAGIGFMIAAAWARQDLHGPVRLGIDYGQRAAEAYWGWLLVHGYFSCWLRQRGARPALALAPRPRRIERVDEDGTRERERS